MIEAPRSEQFDDIYFSAEGGLAESRYVFLTQNQLPEAWNDKAHFVIAETGFGTGLNFLCAWDLFERTAEPEQHLHYYSFEKFPLSAADIQKYLSHWGHEFGGRLEKLVANYPLRVGGWHTLRLTSQVTLTIIFDDVNRALPELDELVDCWFLDGHAPAKNPDMWSDTVFANIGRLSREGTRFATFTAAGVVRRGLQEVGFTVSKVQGFGHKRDMSVGVFEKENPLSVRATRAQKVAVIGGGIAGASVAYGLIQQACAVTVFEKNELASGGSGNIRGLCNPKFTSQRGIEADFYSPAFALAQRVFKKISKSAEIGYVPCGSLHLINDAAKEKRFCGFSTNWDWHSDHVRIVDAQEASEVAGISLSHSAMFLPDAAMVSPRLIVAFLAQSARVIRADITYIHQTQEGWWVDGENYDAVVLTGGVEVKMFQQVSDLPLQKVRGQVTLVKAGPEYSKLKTNLCYGGYSSIPFDGEVVIGSTFQHWIDDHSLRDEDDTDNIRKLAGVAPQLTEGLEIIGARASFRCASKDRMPIIGAVNGHKGLYLSTAHGSHGIVSSLMAAEMLVSKICGLGQVLPVSIETFLSNSRFSK